MGGQREKIFASHVNGHQKVTSAKEDFKNQGLSILCIPVSLFPQLPVSLFNGLINKVVMVTEMKVMHGLSIRDFHSPRPYFLTTLLSAQSTSSKDQQGVIKPFTEVISQQPDSRLITLDSFYYGRGSFLSLLEETVRTWIRL